MSEADECADWAGAVPPMLLRLSLTELGCIIHERPKEHLSSRPLKANEGGGPHTHSYTLSSTVSSLS